MKGWDSMTDPKAKLQEEIERRAEKYGELQDEWPYNEIAKDGFEDGAEFALELMQARELELVSCLTELVDLMDGVYECDYEPDSLTTQPAKVCLEELGLAEGGESGEG